LRLILRISHLHVSGLNSMDQSDFQFSRLLRTFWWVCAFWVDLIVRYIIISSANSLTLPGRSFYKIRKGKAPVPSLGGPQRDQVGCQSFDINNDLLGATIKNDLVHVVTSGLIPSLCSF
jgi:hypothetical protein